MSFRADAGNRIAGFCQPNAFLHGRQDYVSQVPCPYLSFSSDLQSGFNDKRKQWWDGWYEAQLADRLGRLFRRFDVVWP
jgi:hypothetical protein